MTVIWRCPTCLDNVRFTVDTYLTQDQLREQIRSHVTAHLASHNGHGHAA